jgi:hypothetical protein
MDRRTWLFLGFGLLVVLLIATVASGFASSDPDGLEKVAIDEGFADSAEDSATADSPLADYGVEGIENERVSVGIAGVVGVAITVVVTVGLLYGARLLRSKQQT